MGEAVCQGIETGIIKNINLAQSTKSRKQSHQLTKIPTIKLYKTFYGNKRVQSLANRYLRILYRIIKNELYKYTLPQKTSFLDEDEPGLSQNEMRINSFFIPIKEKNDDFKINQDEKEPHHSCESIIACI